MDTEQIKNKIEQEIIATRELVIKYRELTQPIAPENAIGRVSRMDAINNKAVTQAALDKAETKLNNLQVALTKLNDSDFGQCIKCRKKIPMGRILLMPQVVTCVNCTY